MISQRRSPERDAGDRSSVDLESGSEEGVDKFTSGILTYLWVQCYKTIGSDETLSLHSRRRRPEKARGGGEGREFVYRAIVERHFGKHTGLPPFAKACPKDWPSGGPAGALAC